MELDEGFVILLEGGSEAAEVNSDIPPESREQRTNFLRTKPAV